jgi:GST-like protein
MLELYTWDTPNGRKISIMLEELELPYRAIAIDINAGQQFTPEFTAISPNNKIPALVDRDADLCLMESGAILMYLADRSGRFLPDTGPARWKVIEWLMFQMGGIGPMLGQTHHFHFYNPGKAPYAEARYVKEAQRLYAVLERQLTGHEFIAGNEYSIADIATWPWIARYKRQGIEWASYPHVKDWYLRLAARPAVQRGWRVPNDVEPVPIPE